MNRPILLIALAVSIASNLALIAESRELIKGDRELKAADARLKAADLLLKKESDKARDLCLASLERARK